MSMKTSIKTQSKSTACMMIASFFALGSAVFGAATQAAEPVNLTKIVAYGDLNLDTEQGAKVLYARLRNAAQNVCSPLEGRSLTDKTLWQSCFANAVGSAVGKVNKTSVTALHNQTVSRSTQG
jgi:UrcA family protein